MPIQDARLRELKFLTMLEQAGDRIVYTPTTDDSVESQMVVHLLQSVLVNDVGHYAFDGHALHAVQEAEVNRLRDIGSVLAGRKVVLGITHKGRVRRAELEETIQTGRDRDPTGLAIARKYLERDISVALLHASAESPVCVALLDMNGLKAINDDAKNHAIGDAAIRAYLQVIVSRLDTGWDAYRGEGGDEVTLIMRSVSIDAATRTLQGVLQQLQRETIRVSDADRPLSASCGIVAATSSKTDPGALLSRVEAAQYRAKALSRRPGRPSTLAVEDGEATVIAATPNE
ncbi:GGDEF domain-containing protein [Corallococcus praedator]|uniref:diguanylate cyclase n=1 Tax=Corallococcus praedator TaxID=2316724 RepID=A0ABX9QRG2_9BACT|nr:MULTISPECIES: GGDEF domain-containing protein [Corallococcus]RKH36364.1 GGDEF domain-containing protein [Corallococcus sp. CA031C]RKI16580.1 GGDEF domain-containing protein [Corallococcus praedator]